MKLVVPTKKMAKLELRYLVRLDPDTGRWNITRGGKPTGSFARDMNTAVGVASREASIEALSSEAAITVWLEYGGTRNKVWP